MQEADQKNHKTVSLITLGSLCVVSALVGFTMSLGKIHQLTKDLKHEKEKRDQDRQGRTRAEKKLRQAISASTSVSNLAADAKEATASNGQSSGGIGWVAIGAVHSPFKDRRGTPRQGCLVPSSRSIIRFAGYVQPKQALAGLENFSHVWVFGLFHENTNLAKAASSGTDLARSAIKAKIRPPRLMGEKVGVYSTRTPHRHNALGLSLAKIERLDLEKGELLVSGLDLIDKTPVIDIKPYVPRYDSLPLAKIPDWIEEETSGFVFDNVEFSESAHRDLEDLIPKLQFYKISEASLVEQVLKEILSNELRSTFQKKKESETKESGGSTSYELRYDVLLLDYSIVDNTVLVERITEFVETE
jgi:tRNA-Thr(GGU) m(6)t(6)A37 methyltransferase TsaA